MPQNLLGGADGCSPVLTGDIVEIKVGPLAGLRARCTGISGQRVRIALRVKRRRFEIELDLDWLAVAKRELSVISADRS